jgi:hypothetical protein
MPSLLWGCIFSDPRWESGYAAGHRARILVGQVGRFADFSSEGEGLHAELMAFKFRSQKTMTLCDARMVLSRKI